ncbi:CBS domain-containing protein [Haladaptatus halobius]|uniref:CBS domain-containing protein n=1 Tax=Haladaptatus halobius TaxID=2884875 RepID=UPI001D0B5ECD|nr:CBS domain-containing protein [Haladaptatus halobius]
MKKGRIELEASFGSNESPIEVIELSQTIGDHGVRRILIVDENDNLTGIVTLDDIIATIGEQLDNIVDTIEVPSPDYSP